MVKLIFDENCLWSENEIKQLEKEYSKKGGGDVALLEKINAKITQKGLTLIPLKLYFKEALIKMELGVCQGKHTYDKKRSLMEKDLKREKERQIKNYR